MFDWSTNFFLVWVFWVTIVIQDYFPHDYIWLSGIVIQTLEKMLCTSRTKMISLRPMMYLMEMVLRLNVNSCWWYWVALDIWDETNCIGNVVAHDKYRWIKIMTNQTTRNVAIGATLMLYIANHWLHSFYLTLIYFTLLAFIRLAIRLYYPEYLKIIDVNVGEIREKDLNQAINFSQKVAVQMTKQFMGNLMTDDELEEIRRSSNELLRNGMTQWKQLLDGINQMDTPMIEDLPKATIDKVEDPD